MGVGVGVLVTHTGEGRKRGGGVGWGFGRRDGEERTSDLTNDIVFQRPTFTSREMTSNCGATAFKHAGLCGENRGDRGTSDLVLPNRVRRTRQTSHWQTRVMDRMHHAARDALINAAVGRPPITDRTEGRSFWKQRWGLS